MIYLDAAIAAVVGNRELAFKAAQLMVDALRALPTVQPEPAPALGAEWMRREAEKIVGPMAYSNSPVAANAGQAAYNAIRAIPNPTPADLPKVRALVDAMKWAWGHLCTLPMDEANSESLLSFRAALASLTAIPSPAPEPHANALGYPTIADILRDLDHELSDHGYGSRGRVRGLVLAALAKLKGGAV